MEHRCYGAGAQFVADGRNFLTKADLRPSGYMEVLRVEVIPKFVEDRDFRLKAEGRKYVYFPALREMIGRDWYLKDKSRRKGHKVLVVGTGDGADYLKADNRISEAIGCDNDPLKFVWESDDKPLLSLAEHNIRLDHHLDDCKVNIELADGVDYLQTWARKIETGEEEPFDGRFTAYLPQSPVPSLSDSISPSHAYDSSKGLYLPYERPWGDYGLTLISATLSELEKIVTPLTEALVVMSNRVPDEVIVGMIDTAGWEAVEAVVTKTIRHDIDTDLNWMVGSFKDDGRRFKDSKGNPLSVEEAARRTSKIMDIAGQMTTEVVHSAQHERPVSAKQERNIVKRTIARFQRDLDVFEDMTAYRLVPKRKAA